MSVQEKMTAIADAIRSKTGGVEALTLDQMAAEITGISAGGTGSNEFKEFIEGSLTEINSAEITKVGANAVYKQTALTKLTLPNCTYLGQDAFNGCSNLAQISLENYTGTAGDYASQNVFFTCTKMETAYLPNCTSLSNGIFQKCTSLRNLTVSPEITHVNGTALRETAIEEFVYPSVVELKNNVFYGCPNLKKVDITNSSWNVESNVCQNAAVLETFILRSPTMRPLNGTNAFAGTPIESGSGYIYVPSALVDSYKAATNWSAYADQIRAIEDYPEITGG